MYRMGSYDEREKFLKDAAERVPGEEFSLTVRELLSYWNVHRRGSTIVGQIRRALKKYKLEAVPDFEYGWIDNTILLRPIAKKTVSVKPSEDDELDSASDPTAGSLKVGALGAATRGVDAVIYVSPSARLDEAQALMLRYDFSQLPVLSGPRDIRGAVSWESIAIQKMHNPDADLRDCIVDMHVVSIDSDLLPLIPEIITRGYVAVTSSDEKLSGLVTTADISTEFLDMAGPFLLMGECEKHLRRIVEANFTSGQIISAKNQTDTNRQVQSASDLSFGELVRLFEDPERWSTFRWQAERKVFLAALEEARTLRNEIMHFSTDPIDSTSLENLRHLVRWLKIIVATHPAETPAPTTNDPIEAIMQE